MRWQEVGQCCQPHSTHSVHSRIVRTDKDRELTGWLCQLNTVMPTNQRDLHTKHQRTQGFSSVTEVVITHLCLWISHQRHQAQVHWLIIDKSWSISGDQMEPSDPWLCGDPPAHGVGKESHTYLQVKGKDLLSPVQPCDLVTDLNLTVVWRVRVLQLTVS